MTKTIEERIKERLKELEDEYMVDLVAPTGLQSETDKARNNFSNDVVFREAFRRLNIMWERTQRELIRKILKEEFKIEDAKQFKIEQQENNG